MTSRSSWNRGDRVVHTARPEWGAGEVISAQASTVEGRSCQRLSIRFERAGLKTISTAVAELASVARGETPRLAVDPEMFHEQDQSLVEKLVELPEAATDPFRSLTNRLNETLKLFRFTDSPASLMDWAAVQTGVADPLSHFNRHELEEHYRKFKRSRDEHMGNLVRSMHKQEPAQLAAAMASAPEEAKRIAQRSQR